MELPDDVPTLSDGIVTLRAHTAADVDGVYEQCQDPLSQQWTQVPVPYSHADAAEFIGTVIPAGWCEDSEWAFAVEAADDDGRRRFAGTISLRNHGNGRAEVAFGSHPWVRGRGHMRRALELLLAWGFEDRGVRSVIWWANRGNWASRRLAWRLGFSYDGTVRHWLPQRGELLDAWVGALSATDERTLRGRWLEAVRIVGDDVVLRPHRDEDAERVQQACGDDRTAYWLTNLPRPYTRTDAQEFIAGRAEAMAQGTGVHWAVADPTTDDLIANISIFDVDPAGNAEVGYWTHPDARGRGVMTEACALAVRHAFIPAADGGLGLRRLTILHSEANAASRRVIEANDFVETGRRRQDHTLGDGSTADTITYDLLATEYAAAPDTP